MEDSPFSRLSDAQGVWRFFRWLESHRLFIYEVFSDFCVRVWDFCVCVWLFRFVFEVRRTCAARQNNSRGLLCPRRKVNQVYASAKTRITSALAYGCISLWWSGIVIGFSEKC
jgi:hypothetical protein